MSAISITHKIALKPNNKHTTYFKKAFGCARFAYNWGLAKWKENYQLGIKTNHLQLKKKFNALKKSQFNTNTTNSIFFTYKIKHAKKSLITISNKPLIS